MASDEAAARAATLKDERAAFRALVAEENAARARASVAVAKRRRAERDVSPPDRPPVVSAAALAEADELMILADSDNDGEIDPDEI